MPRTPFGNMSAAPQGSTTVDKSTSGPRYNGYYLDAAASGSTTTGQYATGWRPYRPDIGRFTSLDPAGSPNGPNRYNYCGSEPVNRSDPSGTIIRFPAEWGDYGPDEVGKLTATTPVRQRVIDEMMRSSLVYTFDSMEAIEKVFNDRSRLAWYHNNACGFDQSTPYLDGAIEGTTIVRNTAVVVGAVAATGGLAVSAGAAYTAGGATGLVVFGAKTAVTVKVAGLVNEGAQEGLRAAGVDEDFVAPVADVVTAGVMALPVKRLLTPKTNSPAAPTRSRSPMEPAEEGGNLNDYGKTGAANKGMRSYPNPDPAMSEAPWRHEPNSISEVERMRSGRGPTTKATAGTQNIEAHHRQQIPVENGGVIDELTQQEHRGSGNHTRHSQPSSLTPAQRATEIRTHWMQRGAEYLLPGEGL